MHTTKSIQLNLYFLLCSFITIIASPSAAQDDVLKGPDLDSKQRPTIVHQSMSGEFQQVEGRPEIAAFAVVTDDSQLNEHARNIALDRTIKLSLLLVDEIDLMRESTDAMRDGDQKRAREIQTQFHDQFDQGAHNPLSQQLKKLLNDAQQKEYARVLEEYWDAWINWTLRNREAKINDRVRNQTRNRLASRLFQRELAEAYDISLKRYRDALEVIYSAVEPTDEQREAIRSIIIEHIKQTRLEATPQQRRDAMHEIYRLLDDDRKEKLYDYLLRIVVPDVES
jgi:hypothetical protein